MDTTEKLNDTEKETFLLVVGELAQEQANNTKTVNDLIAAVNVLTGKVDEVKEKVDKPKPLIVSADTRPITLKRLGIIFTNRKVNPEND